MELYDPCLLFCVSLVLQAVADLFWLMGDDRRDEHVDWLICRLPGLFGEGGMGGFSGNMAGPGWVGGRCMARCAAKRGSSLHTHIQTIPTSHL